jgi:type I restriction enzyme M protein
LLIRSKIQDPAKLRRLVELINQETWIGMDIDVKGEIYEGLLQKNAEDTKSGAGQYFTPRPLIKAIIDVMRPAPNETICDPACGTGGFLLATHDYISKNYALDIDQKKFLKFYALRGWEIVDNVAMLCVMNLYLHGIGGEESSVTVGDTLISDPGIRFDKVLTTHHLVKRAVLP